MKLQKIILTVACVFIVTACAFQEPDYLETISSAELNKIMAENDIFLMDVHTPRQPHIKGTDLFIPYNAIEKNKDKLPANKEMAIYLYCEGGPMGNAAARSLHDLGYSNLINLRGGANAWRKDGFKFE